MDIMDGVKEARGGGDVDPFAPPTVVYTTFRSTCI